MKTYLRSFKYFYSPWFLVLFNQSEQDQEPLSALALDCLCQTALTPWLVSLPFHRTILQFLLLCEIMVLLMP